MNGGVLWGRPRPGRGCSAVDDELSHFSIRRIIGLQFNSKELYVPSARRFTVALNKKGYRCLAYIMASSSEGANQHAGSDKSREWRHCMDDHSSVIVGCSPCSCPETAGCSTNPKCSHLLLAECRNLEAPKR
jgi:hypothetical protein